MNKLPIEVLAVIGLLLLRSTTGIADDRGGTSSARRPGVLTGIDVLEQEKFRTLQGMSVGLITNQTGVNRSGVSTVRLLHEAPEVGLRVLFSPEHGFSGTLDQRIIGDSKEGETGLKIISLYGETRLPPPESLEKLDAIVFDIQDIGTRFYTYISTMGHAMQAAAEAGIEFVVLDRPNPVNGVTVAGPVLDDGLQSFVGYHTIAVRHGMTVGELAQMIKAEQGLDLKLTVVPIKNWRRESYFDATALLWINPSPNMRNLRQAVLYPGIGLLETTNVSVGRGTDTPFEVLGAPWIDAQKLAAELNDAQLPGVVFVPIRFRPDASKFAGDECGGVSIIVTHRDESESVRTGLTIAVTLRRLFPNDWNMDQFNRLLGDEVVYRAVRDGEPIDAVEKLYAEQRDEFLERRSQFLLY